MPKRCACAPRKQAKYAELRNEPSVTRDGVAIELMINGGLAMDLAQIEIAGAAGIGLFRTELQFMVASQVSPAGRTGIVLSRNAARGRRAPDHLSPARYRRRQGLPYGKTVAEENPALGWRAIRLTLDRPGLIRGQVRALLKAAAGRELRIMVPMVTELREIGRIKEIIDHEIEIADPLRP